MFSGGIVMEHWREMGKWPLRRNTYKFLYPDFVKFLTYLWHGDKMIKTWL